MAKPKRKTDKIKVSFIGNHAESVTGSINLIEFGDRNVLLECGLVQSNSVEKDYKTNLKIIKNIKSKELDTIFVMHTHIDHIGLIPRLYKDGCTAKLIIPKNSTGIMTELLLDSAFIMGKEAISLTNMYNNRKVKSINKGDKNSKIKKTKDLPKDKIKNIEPIYTKEDVLKMLDYVTEYDVDKDIFLDKEISFKYLPSRHLINGCQLLLNINHYNHKKTILYTSDLGNLSMPPLFNGHFSPCSQADLVIAETTYAGRDMHTGANSLKKDLEKLECMIREVCLEGKQKVLIPAFSLDRTQRLLKYIFDILMSDDTLKNIPIYVDSPLSKRITDEYLKILKGEERDMLETILKSKNVRFMDTYADSKALTESSKPCVILSASGMGKGRVKQHIKSVIENEKAMICVCGYACENTLVYRIKNPALNNAKIKDGKQKTRAIKIDGYYYKNKCKIMELHSFSSHIQKKDMMKYYTEINYEKIALVHGNFKDKCDFAEELKKELKNKNRTSKVVAVNKDTTITL